MAIFAGLGIFMLIFGLAMHFFIGYCYKLIAEKTGNESVAWMWWIPIANIWIPFKVSGKPASWLLYFFIPLIGGIVVFIIALMGMETIASILAILVWISYLIPVILWVMVWMEVAEARGHERWWGIIAAIVSIVGIPYLAFADSTSTATATSGGA